MQTKTTSSPAERGISLLAALLAVLLLSVIGFGMMYATNAETSINANYRDKQVAIYAALSGLQEARDRIHPATRSISAPTALPSIGAANVIYIINPKNGETVAPWLTMNKYFDSEFCHESVLGLTGTPGVPCTAIPSGSGWYTVVDNSLISSAPWNLSAPLEVKWIRITVKGNNMTPVPVNGDASDGRQVCWDGAHQIVLPAGYGTACSPNGSIASITLTASGTGYISPPTVSISAPGPGGTQATATATLTPISNGQVASVSVTNAGANFTSAPAVSFSGGGGSGATATAVIVPLGAAVDSINLTNAGGQCYAVPPTVALAGGGGAGATTNATLAPTKSCIASWTPSGSCSSKRGQTISGVGLTGGGGSGFSGTIKFKNGSGQVSSWSIEQPGSGYASAPTTITGLSACPSLTFTANVGYFVRSLSLTSGGAGYTSAPAVNVATGTGTAAAAPTGTTTLGASPPNAGKVVAINVTSPGTGYTSPPAVMLTGGGGGGATANASLGSTYTVGSVNLTNAGSGYTADPTVTISGGGGSGATATALIGRGSTYGRVFLITSLAQTASGARAMSQMEVASSVLALSLPAALTLDGPSPVIGSMPNSNNFVIHGADNNSCSETAQPPRPAIGGYDNPDADPPTNSVDTIISSLPRPDHYTGAGGTPSVQNVYGQLGDTMSSPGGLKSVLDAIAAAPAGSGPSITYVDGDLSLSGNGSGSGILVVTGTLRMGGNFSWHGVILVIGDGVADFNGGGNGQIVGAVLVANIWDNHTNQNLRSTLGSPRISWNGGGGNGILYDHCWADNQLNQIPLTTAPSTKPLKVLNTRTLLY